ncbi:P1 family peptidase [Bowmanella yangjiangensis]|uniref:P1 family peptidase n=1 Tax=Bowmanella yangjiangensis TaxID=2811230 RepID=A0ABS3CYF9_9ALTE|nr:P1 family peptidase [Bowmanella yangjiangensis]MBN7822156.1 P1 family peptidase [Bowmanella yangjiangensis]
MWNKAALTLLVSGLLVAAQALADDAKPRSRDLGIAPGILKTGQHNAITDVQGVLVGQVTLVNGQDVRTGVTAILPHGGNLYQDKVPAGLYVANGYGKLTGISQIQELGEIETPILLTNTLSVPQAAEAIIGWTLKQPGNEQVVSVNAVVGETNDSRLNDIRKRALKAEHGLKAITSASSGPVAEGAVGAGTGTVAFGWKGGIGTSSRVLPAKLGGYTVGVLVQSNYGGVLQIAGQPVGEALGQYYLKDALDSEVADGSIMLIVATDAPLSDRNLTRLAKRAVAGLARTGASFTNGSGDYVLSFSTAASVRRTAERRGEVSSTESVPNGSMSPLFQAVIEASEEAIYNSMLKATDTCGTRSDTGKANCVKALPLEQLKALLTTSN